MKLVFKKQIGNRDLALKAEKRVKKLPKARKERLIEEAAGIEIRANGIGQQKHIDIIDKMFSTKRQVRP